MSLPILKSSVVATPQTLLRFFHQTELQWTRHMAEETQLDVGTAMHNAEMPRVYMANRMLDVALPDGMTPEAAMEQVSAHFSACNAVCWQWVMNPSAPPERTTPMVEFLRSVSYSPEVSNVMHLSHLPIQPIEGTAGTDLTIIPARASFRHARMLMEESSRKWNEPHLADAAMTHLDDPHYDALLALKDGAPAAYIAVLAMGEVGLIDQVYVAEAFRARGFATVMMSRALEICARSLFKQILLCAAPTSAIAIHIYEKFGFAKVGEFVAYMKDGLKRRS